MLVLLIYAQRIILLLPGRRRYKLTRLLHN